MYTIAREAGQVILELEDNRYAKWAALRIGCAFAAEGKGRGLLLHATGLAHTERSVAVIGLAQSGGGKSTLTDLALGWHSLSDETVYVEASDDAPCAYGLPFRSSASKQPEPLAARIGAFLILEKSLVSGLEPVSQDVALRALLNQAYRPLGLMESQSEFFRCAARIARSAPCFRFKFDKTLESVSGLLNQFLDDHRLASHPR
ncbi:MAG: hypothetical protein HY901_07510 [Deltaproteobacteria bacterium]|nr:hypothetical protein [Deltaproteobacteria bacterium]